MRFKDKVALVTGAAQGIGRATAQQLAAEGATLVLVDRAERECREVLEEIKRRGGAGQVAAFDLETADGARAAVELALACYGRIDVAVHNVGGTIWIKPFWEYSDSEMESEISRSLWPTLWCCRAVVPVMLKQGFGSIVNVGSFATRGIFRVPYSAAKGGVHTMTASLSMELAERGIRVNCVAPGGMDDPQRNIPRNPNPVTEQEQAWRQQVAHQSRLSTPMGRRGRVEEPAAAICFLASDEASYITGQVLFVAGGGIG
jgi:dihydroxycyclohexadiene carboxylate dehydrogenase